MPYRIRIAVALIIAALQKTVFMENIHRANVRVIVLFLVGLALSFPALGQDSVQVAQDTTITGVMLREADSLHRADSLEQAVLAAQLAALKESDQRQKAALQAKIDSLSAAQAARQEVIRRQVDSLRSNTPGAPVVLYSDTLFYIYASLGPFSPADRAASLVSKVEDLVGEVDYDSTQWRVVAEAEVHNVVYGHTAVLSVTDRDAFFADQPREQLAGQYLASINTCIYDYQERTGLWHVLVRVGWLLLVIGGFALGLRFLNRGLRSLQAWALIKLKPKMTGVKIRSYELLSAEREAQLVAWLMGVAKWLIILLVLYLILPVVFSIFPATKGIATRLIGYILHPLQRGGQALLGFLPELFTIVVIILAARYFLRFLKFLAQEVAEEKLSVPGFYPDWALPTHNLLKILVYAFTFILIFPYLPGSDSEVFKGVSVFLGLLISLGSSSAISNIIAGLVITYMRAFRIGDRVKIGDTTGDVVEKSMLVTRLRTIKNEDVTIPNSAILNGSTVNYSSSAQALGLVLSSTVTIGYDVPWRQVHELLIGAAQKCEHILPNPRPFVLQTSLDDFYVSYQINAYTHEASKAARIYSELHANIQDAFNEAGVEILSPHYRAARDGNQVTIPPGYLPPDYQAPAFQVQNRPEKT